MSLDSNQRAALMEIVGIDSLVELDWRLSAISAAQETRIIADIALWDTLKDDFTILAGGRDGIQINPDNARQAIISRLKLHLQLSNSNSTDSGFVRLVRS